MSKCCGHCNKLKVNIGDKFNEWTVVDNTEYNKGKSNKLLCKCSCGRTTKEIRVYDLRDGKTKRCLYCDSFNLKKGMKFNEWTILEDGLFLQSDKVLCSCSCGRTIQKRFAFEIVKGGSPMCIKCSNETLENSLTHEDYLRILQEKNIDIKVIGKYKGYDVNIAHQCPICKKDDWMEAPGNIIRSVRMCNDCATKIFESKHANILKQIYKYNYPNTICEDKSCISPITKYIMPTDIVDHEKKISIEIQSKYHDNENQKIKDEIKKHYWDNRGYTHYQLDIRDYTILEMIQIFFPEMKEIPKWVDQSYNFSNRDWSLEQAQKLLNEGSNMLEIAEIMDINVQNLYYAKFDKSLVVPDNYIIKRPERRWSLKEAQDLLNDGLMASKVAEKLGVCDKLIYKIIHSGELIKPEGYGCKVILQLNLDLSIKGKFKDLKFVTDISEKSLNLRRVRLACKGKNGKELHKYRQYLWYYKEDYDKLNIENDIQESIIS